MKKAAVLVLASLIFISGCGKTVERKEVSDEKKEEWIDVYAEKIEKLNADGDWALGFAIYDVDEDGIPELFAESGTRTYDVYAFEKGETRKIGEIFNRPYVTFKDNSIFAYGGVGTGAYGGLVYTFEDGNFYKKETFSASSFQGELHCFFAVENIEAEIQSGEEISEEEYNELLGKYRVKEFTFFQFADIKNDGKTIEDFVTVK